VLSYSISLGLGKWASDAIEQPQPGGDRKIADPLQKSPQAGNVAHDAGTIRRQAQATHAKERGSSRARSPPRNRRPSPRPCRTGGRVGRWRRPRRQSVAARTLRPCGRGILAISGL